MVSKDESGTTNDDGVVFEGTQGDGIADCHRLIVITASNEDNLIAIVSSNGIRYRLGQCPKRIVGVEPIIESEERRHRIKSVSSQLTSPAAQSVTALRGIIGGICPTVHLIG